MTTYQIQAGGRLQGELQVPGDKSISHRSIMLGSLAEGTTHISGFLEGEDSLATLNAFQAMGVPIARPATGEVVIHGVGISGLQKPENDLYLGNSGTSMRLLSGLLAGQAFDTTLTGDNSLSGRPMRRVTNPLTEMGAVIDSNCDGTAPLNIRGGLKLKAINYNLPVASAQVKSAVLLAGLYAAGETVVIEPAPTRDHTERMLRGLGYEVESSGNKISLNGGGKLTATDIQVPADISSATFFLVGATIAKNSKLLLKHVGINPTRIGVINILKQMGANIKITNERTIGGEPVADIEVCSAELHGINIDEKDVPLAIDEFPALFIAAANATGTTILTGASELRVKESDRIQVMADGLKILGVKAEPQDDGIIIEGGEIGSGEIDSYGDHRIAMSFAMAALTSTGTIQIKDCANVNTSFPGFVQLASKAGLKIQEL